MAVADFLENVDLKALGLGESEKKVMRYMSIQSHNKILANDMIAALLSLLLFLSPVLLWALSRLLHRRVSPRAFVDASSSKSTPSLVQQTK